MAVPTYIPPIAAYDPNTRTILNELIAQHNEIVRQLAALGGGGGAEAQQLMWPLKIVAPLTSSGTTLTGKYSAKLFWPPAVPVANQSLSAAEIGTTRSTADAEVWHLSDITGNSSMLAAGQAVLGRHHSYTAAGLPIYLVGNGQSGLFPVKVEKTGGSDGSKTTTASWTYTVQDIAGNELGTTVALARPRPKGKMTYQTGTFSGGTAGYGTAFYDGSTLKLWDAGETPTTGSCP